MVCYNISTAALSLGPSFLIVIPAIFWQESSKRRLFMDSRLQIAGMTEGDMGSPNIYARKVRL
jgi:hypothetical protein